MLTGRQLKAARALLGIPRSKLAERMSIPRLTIKIAESVDGECPITVARARQVQSYLERQGIEFLPAGREPAARLSTRPASPERHRPGARRQAFEAAYSPAIASIASCYGHRWPDRAFARAMAYTVTFYALRPGLGEVVVSIHRVEKGALAAYTGTPGVALAAARTVKGEPRADGFRVADDGGRVMLDYLDRPGRG